MKLILLQLIFLTVIAIQGSFAASVATIVKELEDTGALYEKECLPENKSEAAIKEHHKKHGLSEKCWKFITRINHLDNELQKIKLDEETKVNCENGRCQSNESSLVTQVTELQRINRAPVCTTQKKQEIKNKCNDELTCVFVGSATGVFGLALESLLPSSMKMKDCNLGNDNCTTQLVTSFLDAAVTFFRGSWELLKWAGTSIGNSVKDLWEHVVGAENHSSTSQLALAKASEDPGIFEQLKNDFPGTMKKIWQTFVASTKEWLKNDVFCQKWEGIARGPNSRCIKPTESFDCISCKSYVNGLCAISGTLVAEVVPAFLTGGIISAVKYGVNSATKISKLYKVSDKTMRTIKASRMGTIANSVDNVASLGGKIASTTLNLINKILLSPLRKNLKASYTALTELMKTGPAQLVITSTGKVISFTGTTIDKSLRIITYPINNQLTALAYKAGSESVEKVLSLGKPSLASKTAATASVLSRKPDIEAILIRLEEAKIAGKADDIVKLEEVLYSNVLPFRKEAVKSLLDDGKFAMNDVIKSLYPELQYGQLARTVTSKRVLDAEKELYLEIMKVKDPAIRSKALSQYNQIVNVKNTSRVRIAGTAKTPEAPKTPIAVPTAIEKDTASALKDVAKIKRAKPGSTVVISLKKDRQGKLLYAIDGVNTQADSVALIESLTSNKTIVDQVFNELKKNGNRIDFKIPSNTEGILQLNKVTVQTVRVHDPLPPKPNNRWTTAPIKIVSPTLRVAGTESQEVKEKKREKRRQKSQKKGPQ